MRNSSLPLIFFLISSLILNSNPLIAATIDLQNEIEGKAAVNIYEPLKDKEVKKLSPLARLKYFESRNQWESCVQLSPSVFASQKDLKPWILTTWFNCALKIQENVKATSKTNPTKTAKKLEIPLAVLKENLFWLDRGPWKTGLTSAWIRSHQILWEMSSSDGQKEKWRDRLSLRPELLTPEQKNQFNLGEGGFPPSRVKYLIKFDSPSEEKSSEDAVQAELDKKNIDTATKLIVEHLRKYPGGSAARRFKEKIYDLWTEVSEKSLNDRKSFLSRLKSADSERCAEWASWAHRKALYMESSELAAKAVDSMGQRASVLSPLYVLARSQLFLGQYDEAKKNFESLQNQFSSTEEGAEALFRLGLLHYRLGNFDLARQNFEKLLSQGKEKLELNSRYWWVRSLEALKDPRESEEKSRLIQDYPFSYYGLRLRAESQNRQIEFENKILEKNKSASIQLYGDQLEIWKRFKTLSKNGWIIEAQSEIQSLPTPQRAEIQTTWAFFLLERHQYPLALRLINSAMEQNESFRHWGLLKMSFPQIYSEWIQSESKKYGLKAQLIQSLIRQESAFGLKATSTSNALGLMQLIPPTAQDVARRLNLKIAIPEDLYRPEINIPMGTFYFNSLLEEFKGHIPLALAAYNAGPSRLKLWLRSRKDTENIFASISTEPKDEIWIDELPWNETSFYVKAILRNMILYPLTQTEKSELKPGFWSEFNSKNTPTQ